MRRIILTTMLMVSVVSTANAWDDEESHKYITRAALVSHPTFNMGSFLTSHFDLPLGLQTQASGMMLDRHFVDGSQLEDEGKRGLNHFHDPTREEWDAGLRDGYGIFRGISAIEWAREGTKNAYDYHDFRYYYFRALTAPSEENRVDALASLSRTTGQLLHLVEDMAVPAHTRNDLIPGHTCDFVMRWIPVASTTEEYLRRHPECIRRVTAEEIPSMGRFEDYFDTGTYRSGGGVPVSGTGVGLAEYVNGNFYSEGTTSVELNSYPHPALDETYLWYESVEGRIVYPEVSHLLPFRFYRVYIGRKSDDPERNIAHLAATCYWYDYTFRVMQRGKILLDDACRAEYLRHLAPKAVAYAAGLMGHLFRVDVDFSYDEDRQLFVIRNLGGDDLSGGFSFHYDRSDGTRAAMPNAAWTLTIPAGGEIATPVVRFPRDIDLDRTLALFYSGRAGTEEAVPGGRVRKLDRREFKVLSTRAYQALTFPDLSCYDWHTENPNDMVETCTSQFYSANVLSPRTMYRISRFMIMLKTTPELARRIHVAWAPDQWVRVSTSNFWPSLDPSFVERFEMAVSPDEWKVVYDAAGSAPDDGWGGVANPLAYWEGPLPGEAPLEAFGALHNYENSQSLCEPRESWESTPRIYVTFASTWDPVTGAVTDQCPNFAEIRLRMFDIHQSYVDFYDTSLPSLMEPYAGVLNAAGWENYGFRVRLKQLLVITPREEPLVVADQPITLVKPWGQNIVEAY